MVTVIDLFAGAGGFSEGFVRAGFSVVLAVDSDTDACRTLEGRGHRVLQAEITQDSIADILSGERAEVLIAGLPCQAYSMIGRSCIIGSGKNIYDDCRLYHYRSFAKALKILKPVAFVVENVEGLTYRPNRVFFEDMMRLFCEAGYTVTYSVLNAADYGVPQNRRRLFIVGIKGKQFRFPAQSREVITVRQALQGLPEPDVPSLQHTVRKISERTKEIYRFFIQAFFKGEKVNINSLPDHLKTKPRRTFLDRYKVLDPDRPAHTIVAHLSKDGNHFIYPDPDNPRSITVREAARLQTFPDDYRFAGSMSSAFRQVGNAVPVKLAEAVARELMLQVFR